MIITWSIFITLSPLFFHNDLKDVNFIPSFMCKVRKWMEDALKMKKIIGHFMIYCQLQQFTTLSIFVDFEWFKSQNVIQEVYFMPSFLVKSKFQVEGHVWMQKIIGHFMIFCQLQQFTTLSIFGYCGWFKSNNFIQEIYFMPYFLVKNKFQVESHVPIQECLLNCKL